eukprot:616294-Hanusia_phi.AAC.1
MQGKRLEEGRVDEQGRARVGWLRGNWYGSLVALDVAQGWVVYALDFPAERGWTDERTVPSFQYN